MVWHTISSGFPEELASSTRAVAVTCTVVIGAGAVCALGSLFACPASAEVRAGAKIAAAETRIIVEARIATLLPVSMHPVNAVTRAS